MRAVLVFLLLSLVACEDLVMPQQGGAAGASGGTGAAGSGPEACPGFRDVAGQCLDVRCLGSATCTSETAAATCNPGVGNEGTCVNGLCVYRLEAQGCTAGDQCPCGICGPDGKCYGDRDGSCGTCTGRNTTSTKPGSSPYPACNACLSGCQGTGPSCCAGCGCACEGVCGVCK